ncbi:ion transporter [Aliiglaciecola sp. LCG003]|uniref:ion transporter n=1 Tax=Aliiglaciecola sp. LCG003 TaxID=3053655 RepID=UPI0025730EBC|nr:ion transporter [Aliiglaciecola sp. LCG003]WJG10647.1 ion transporter [Aliiglaciecola sp. LCG003]
MLGFNRSNLLKSHEGPWLILDLSMLGLLMINLAWIIFDSLYATDFFRQSLNYIAPGIVDSYAPVHANFLLIDLVFVAVFLTEFCFRWIAAVYRKTYFRWYFFPFIHWYDLVGCIPLGAARIFRFLRIFSILHRLHKYQIIDLRSTALFRFMGFYYDVLVEELSDRIVVKVLTDAQKDIAAGSPLVEDISRNVIATRLPILSQWTASVLTHIGESIEHNEHGKSVRQHVNDSVGKAVRGNPQISTLKLVPVLGSTIERTLEQAVTDIVTQSIVNLLKDITADKIDDFVEHGIGRFSAEDHQLDIEVLAVVNECIELIKVHVSHQRWKSA